VPVIRLDAANGIVTVRNEAMTLLRDEEKSLREANRKLQHTVDEHTVILTEKDSKVEELTQGLKIAEAQVTATNARNTDLQNMCNGLTEDLQYERKLRY
jgi:hypothetical protein